MSKNQEYASQYAEYAMQQMKRYGIPASVTLAQGILESSNGQSELSRLGNNHFGIKSTNSWLKNGGEFLVYTDDRPDEKFCKYDSVGDSYEHHSEFLKNNKRYEECFKLSPDDYKGWTQGIAKAGYATGDGYAKNLQSIIERNNLQKYDQMVMKQLQEEGKSIGITNYPRNEHGAGETRTPADTLHYSFPVDRKDFILVTSAFGENRDGKSINSGIDIKTNREPVLSIEDLGKVVSVTNESSGKSVTVEYQHDDGNKIQMTYSGLSNIDAEVGETVSAGQRLGMTGNIQSGKDGETIHLEVTSIAKDGSSRTIDPAAYLSDVARNGNIDIKLLHDGNDLLEKYKVNESKDANNAEQMTPDTWMKKLLSSEDSSLSTGHGLDPIMEMTMQLYSGLLMLATQIDSKSDEESMQMATETALSKKIDLSTLLPGYQRAELLVQSNSPLLVLEKGNVSISHELTEVEKTKISQTLGNENLSENDKSQRIANVINSIVISEQISKNYEQGMEQQIGQSESMQRK